MRFLALMKNAFALVGITTALVLLVGISVILLRGGEKGVPVPPPIATYGMETLLQPGIYDGYSEEQIRVLLDETWNRAAIQKYDDYSMTRESLISGKFVNVVEEGGFSYRKIADQAAFPPPEGDTNVFVFGGSSLFGYGVPDWDTLPSYLQAHLRKTQTKAQINVFNFGRGYFYSAQERILFERLLIRRVDMDVAIFVDGINEKGLEDMPNVPYRNWDPNQCSPKSLRYLGRAALDQLLIRMSPTQFSGRRAGETPPDAPRGISSAGEIADREHQVPIRYHRNLRMTEAVCREYQVACLHVWQPIGGYAYDLGYFPFLPEQERRDSEWLLTVRSRWEAMEEYVRRTPLPHFLYLGRIQENLHRPLYVDGSHYNGFMNNLMAKEIADSIPQAAIGGAARRKPNRPAN